MGGRAGFGAVDEECQADVGSESEGFVAEGEVTDQGMVERLGAGPVLADVVGGPAGAEVIASPPTMPGGVGSGGRGDMDF